MTARKRIKDALAWMICRLAPPTIFRDPRYFDWWQRRGWHATPVHFDSPIPDTRELPERHWGKVSELPGLRMNEARQLALLADFQTRYKSEYERLADEPDAVPHRYYRNQRYFGPVDAEILYCMIRRFQPRRILEVGSGFSTMLAAEALEKNRRDGAAAAELIAVEPYPSAVLKGGFPGLTRLIESPVQRLALEEFQTLAANDILLIDSTHVVRIAGDVLHLYLEVLPRLKPGVLIHAHDIFLPLEYPEPWVMRDRLFWSEQYLLQAFLAFNPAFEILWAGAYMHVQHPERLASAFDAYRPVLPGSIWLRKLE